MQPPGFDKESFSKDFIGVNRLPRSYKQILTLLALGVLFHTVVRILFYIWNLKNFSGSPVTQVLEAFLWGLRFDASASATFLVPAVIVSIFLRPWLNEKTLRTFIFLSFAVLLVPALIINFVDVEMINFVGRRFTWGSLFMFREVQGKGTGYVKDYAGLMFGVFVFLVLVVGILWKLIYRWSINWASGTPGKISAVLSALVMVFVLVICVRGGLQKKPLSYVQAQIFSSGWLNNLVLNTSFSIIKSAGQETIPRYQFFHSDEQKLSYLNAGLPGENVLDGHRAKASPNVVIIIMESFSLEYMGAVNGDKGYTPFLDELAEKSLFFKAAVANGRRSIEGVPAVLSGVPTLMEEAFITSPYANNQILKVPEVLKSRGYRTAFFHGGHNGTMYFDSFAQSMGYQDYFGANEYPNATDDDDIWGIYDGPFFQFFAKKLTEFNQPFFASIFSLSSHQPYKIPTDVAGQFPAGPIPVLQSVAYADDSLRRFFATAEKQAWYKNTLFIITADHTQMSYRKDFQNDVSKYRIPIIFFHPDFNWPKIDTGDIVQQIDIPLSILDFLNIPVQESIPLDRSVFRPGDKSAAIFLDGKYFLISKDFFLTWLPGQEPKMFATGDPFQDHELQGPAARKKILFNRLKAQAEFFDNGLLDNKLLRPQR